MRKIIPVFFSLFTLLGATSLSAQQEDVSIVIDSTTTMDQLAAIKMTLLEHEAYFNMYDLEFNERGQVRKISVRVDFGDGYRGSAKMEDFSQGQQLRIIRNYSDKKRPFCIGECKP